MKGNRSSSLIVADSISIRFA